MSILISQHFSWSEANCHDGQEVPPEHRDRVIHLAEDVLEPIRARWREPIFVVSWWRSERHNKAVGGAPHSRHVQGDAADITPINRARNAEFARMIEEMLRDEELPDLGGLGVYPGWTHVDARPRPVNGHVARWYGKGFGSEA